MGPPKLKRSASSSLSRNYRLEPSLSYSSNRRNSTLTNNDDIMEDDDDEQDPQELDEDEQDNRPDEDRDSLSVNSIEREMTLKDRQEVYTHFVADQSRTLIIMPCNRQWTRAILLVYPSGNQLCTKSLDPLFAAPTERFIPRHPLRLICSSIQETLSGYCSLAGGCRWRFWLSLSSCCWYPLAAEATLLCWENSPFIYCGHLVAMWNVRWKSPLRSWAMAVAALHLPASCWKATPKRMKKRACLERSQGGPTRASCSQWNTRCAWGLRDVFTTSFSLCLSVGAPTMLC